VERQSLFQRELMLDTVIQATPLALVLTNNADAVVYSNSSARRLFAEGRKLEGDRFALYLERAPAPLREGHRSRRGHAVHARDRRRTRGLHVSQRSFLLNALPHRLLLLKQLTREINSQEGRDLEER
jgi:PAS domain-containing protein